MSKSTGNVVDPVAVINEWGVDAFRFYVVRELDIGPDGNWTDAGFRARYPAELANGLGNLVNRSLSMLKRYRNGVVPAKHDELAAAAAKAADETRALLKQSQCKPHCKASGDWSPVPTSMWTRPNHSAWPRIRRRPNDSMKCFIT